MATLRWLLVLPAAIGSYIAGLIAVSLFLLLSCTCIPQEASAVTINDISWRTVLLGFLAEESPWVLKILASGVASYCFVWGGSSVAPYRKTSTAIASTILLLIFIVPLDLFAVHSYSIGIRLLDISATITACVLACIVTIQKDRRLKQKVGIPYWPQCPNCHSLTLPDDKFCGNCGAPL